MYEIADVCKECQRIHIKKKGGWKVPCRGIPKKLWEEGIFPLEEVYGEGFEQLSDDEKLELEYKMNKLAWAKDFLNWTPCSIRIY